MDIQRELYNKIINNKLTNNKVIIIYGPRRIGKTTLVKSIQSKLNLKTLFINCDLEDDLQLLTKKSVTAQKNIWKDNELIIIDEAQRKKDIGLILKIAIDNFPDKKFIVTGSSSIELSNEITESLIGRKIVYHLFPISIKELSNNINIEIIKNNINDYLIYGHYPELFSLETENQKKEYLINISNDYLYKDVLEYSNIKKPEVLKKLLKLLAYQIGSEVSHHEIATILNINQRTVYNYLDLLEKSFVIYRLTAFSNNLRNEINKKEKIYFCDLGIRNAILNDFNPINLRKDKGSLFENFIILERYKNNVYQSLFKEFYFWRTYNKSEIDLVERNSQANLFAFEIKMNNKIAKCPKKWTDTYKDSSFQTINLNNYIDFIF